MARVPGVSHAPSAAPGCIPSPHGIEKAPPSSPGPGRVWKMGEARLPATSCVLKAHLHIVQKPPHCEFGVVPAHWWGTGHCGAGWRGAIICFPLRERATNQHQEGHSLWVAGDCCWPHPGHPAGRGSWEEAEAVPWCSLATHGPGQGACQGRWSALGMHPVPQ